MVAAAAVVVLLALVGSAVALVRGAGGPPHPDAWDPRVQPIADFVAGERDLEFDEPVYVEFLTPAEYTEKTRGSDDEEVSEESQQELDDAVGELRALGLIEGEVDLGAAGEELADTGSLAFYSHDNERIYVRGTELTPALRGTLAHELTHVVQDQHFGLDRLDTLPDAESTALRAVAEGDADGVEDAFVEMLSPEDRMVYEQESQAGSDDAEAELEGKVPPILTTYFGAPYVFGKRFVGVIEAADPSASVDDALRDPPSSEEQLLDPFTYLDEDEPVSVDAPSVPEGAEELRSETFGALTWYLMLSERLDDKEALRAVDGWGGDQYVVYRAEDARVCVASRFQGDTPEDTAEMAAALMRHADLVVTASGGVTDFTVDGGDGEAVEFRSCDPGADATVGATGQSEDALVLPIVRTDITTSAIEAGADQELAVCYSQQVVDRLPIDTLTTDDTAVLERPDVVEAMNQARLACS